MDKQQIVDEIKRVAAAQKGKAPGVHLFQRETGIRKADWYPNLWLRWGDALKEAGFAPNQLQAAISPEVAIEKMVVLIKELGRFPVEGEIRLRSKSDPGFPSHTTFNKLGGKKGLTRAIADYCRKRGGLDDVLEICAERIARSHPAEGQENTALDGVEGDGFVYLMKSGRYFKIGRTDAVGRRQRELSVQLPEELEIIHHIRTDDPSGIEAYWHRRFAERRQKGEWFDLTRAEVNAFKRRRTFM
ncbi:MAG: GIY-YIG nuclease family protein [Rhodospirillaceae bacterium]|nr:MAG: GIY-YIG nuclease family protein [Rhodospirillaceae bacterium]